MYPFKVIWCCFPSLSSESTWDSPFLLQVFSMGCSKHFDTLGSLVEQHPVAPTPFGAIGTGCRINGSAHEKALQLDIDETGNHK
jgi:hypothetical protein